MFFWSRDEKRELGGSSYISANEKNGPLTGLVLWAKNVLLVNLFCFFEQKQLTLGAESRIIKL